MSFSIDGKTAIVTGAANGIGLAIARHFAEHGANVMFADMDEASLQKEVDNESSQSNLRYFAGDLREKLTIANLLSATLDSFDRVDILINASRQMMASDLLDLNDNSVETLLNQNFMTSLRLSQLIATRMIKQSGSQTEGQAGAIVNLSSIAARRAHPQLLGYSVSTAALDQMTRAMAVALAMATAIGRPLPSPLAIAIATLMAMDSLRNVCAVKGVGEDDEDTQPRRSTRQRKTTKKE